MKHLDVQRFRDRQIATLPAAPGVYALVDITGAVRFLGIAPRSLRADLRRHVDGPSRSFQAYLLFCHGAIAWVWLYPVPAPEDAEALRGRLVQALSPDHPLQYDGAVPGPAAAGAPPRPHIVPILPETEIARRNDPARLLDEQLTVHRRYAELLGVVDEAGEIEELKRALEVSLRLLAARTAAVLALLA